MFRTFLAACITLAAVPAAAEPLEVSSTVMVAAKLRAADGSTRVQLVKAGRVVPGDRITVVIDYRNTGGAALSDLAIANPVPAGLSYRGPAQGSAGPDLSVDGRTFGSLAGLTISASGSARAATLDDVTHIRWRLAQPLKPGARGRLAFEALLK